jgi:hypothetical protein
LALGLAISLPTGGLPCIVPESPAAPAAVADWQTDPDLIRADFKATIVATERSFRCRDDKRARDFAEAWTVTADDAAFKRSLE